MNKITAEEVARLVSSAKLTMPPAERRGARESVYMPLLRTVLDAAPKAISLPCESTSAAERLRAGLNNLAGSSRPDLIGEGKRLRTSVGYADNSVQLTVWIAEKPRAATV